MNETATSPLAVTGVDFVTVPAQDIDASMHFYGTVLGLPFVKRWGDMPAAEFVAFMLVALAIGWLWAALLFLGTTAIGLLILRRAGRRDFDRFRSTLGAQGIRAINLETPGLATMIGGILLVLPGFITDVAGALLLLPTTRRLIGAAIGRAVKKQRAARQPEVLDLAPDEWHQISETIEAHDRERLPPRQRKRNNTLS